MSQLTMRTFMVPILFILVGLAGCQELKSLLDICANPPKTPPKALSDKIALPETYKVSGSVSDFLQSSTSLLTETANSQRRVLERLSRDQLPERWIEELTGDKEYMFVNVTAGTCSGEAPRAKLIENARFAKVLGNDSSSLASIVNGLINFDKTQSGFLIENHSEIVGGVNSAKWIACVNGTSANDTQVIVEVRYAGEEAVRPAQSAFSNPLILSIRLAELATFNSTSAISHISFEFDRYELPSGTEAHLEHGIYCTGRNISSLPLKTFEEYAAVLNFYDHSTNQSEVVEILYSLNNKFLIVAGSEMEKGVRFLKVPPARMANGTDYIIHDFKYGYAFSLVRDACSSFGSLDESTYDVQSNSSSTLLLKPLNSLLVDPVLEFAEYESDTDLLGVVRRSYRAYDLRDDTIVELHVTDQGEVLSTAIYRSGSRHLAVTMTVVPLNYKSSKLHHKLAQMSDCYDGGKFANNTWIMDIRDKNVTDIENIGLNNLNQAVAQAISTSVYPIIPYRILVFWMETAKGGISMILRMAEKSEKTPGQVGYNYTAELPTGEIFKLMNETVFAEKMPIVVEKVDGKKEEWMVDAKSMMMYPPEHDNGFIGYTGGAMFVLAIFCLLIGVTIGAVGVFVATRRQRISTLAYQVFE